MPINSLHARVAGALTAAALLAGGALAHDGRPGTGTAPASAAAPAGLGHAFAVLRRPRAATDTLGGRTNGLPTSQYHADRVRRLPSTPPSGAARPRLSEGFVAPGPGGTLCLLAIPPGFEGPGGFCLPGREALRGDLVYAVGAGKGRVEVSGVVPDGVPAVTVRTRKGRVARLPVRDNGYGAILDAPPAEVRFDLAGRTRRLPF